MADKSKVYFTDLRVRLEDGLLKKLDRLIRAAGMETIDFKNKFAAIKIHFGEPGNLAFLRPNFSKVVADLVKEKGGRPFLTDCNTLYVGRRKNAIDHIEAAYENGYSPFSTGCQAVSYTHLLRFTQADVEFKSISGLRISSSAIRYEGIQKGVYVSRGETMQFRPVTILYESPGFVICLETVSYTHLDVYKRQRPGHVRSPRLRTSNL